MEWQKYTALFKMDLSEVVDIGEEKIFLKNYSAYDIPNEVKERIKLVLASCVDINNMLYNKNDVKLDTLEHVGSFFQNRIALEPRENFEIAYLDKALNLIKVSTPFKGGLTSSVVDVRVLLNECLSLKNVAYIINAHNHPSGSLVESREDVEIDKRIREAFKFINVHIRSRISYCRS